MKVFVVDDHALFRDGIVSLLEAADFTVVGQASNGKEALPLIAQFQPDVVLMDILMPEQDGLTTLRQVKLAFPHIKVVMLTVSEDEENLFAAIRAGANGYLLKNLDSSEFIDLLSGLSRGDAALTRKMATRLMEGFARASQAGEHAVEVNLTARETDLLEMIAHGLSNKAIAQQLGLSENTIKYHIRNIMEKLGAQNRTEAVTNAMRIGLINFPDKQA